MNARDTQDQIIQALKGVRIPMNSEAEAQSGVEAALTRAGISFTPQVRLDAESRPDVMVGPVAIEIKVKGSRPAIFRQLERYSEHDEVHALILVSAVAWPFASGVINDKPFRLHRLSEGWL